MYDSTDNAIAEDIARDVHELPAMGSSRGSTAPNTALNVFKFALGTLSSASDNIPIPGVKLAIDTLLTITRHVQVI